MADQEAKIDVLRQKARADQPSSTSTEIPETSTSVVSEKNEHVNFFSDLETGKYASTHENADHVKEKKDEQEKYEKQIGYLTYLGQDTNEQTGKRDWYEIGPKRKDQTDADGNLIEVNLKAKLLYDPIKLMEKYAGRSYTKSSLVGNKKEDAESPTKLEDSSKSKVEITKYNSVLDGFKSKKRKSKKKKSKHKKKKRKHQKSGSSSSSSSSEESEDEETRRLQKLKLEKLRAERLRREKVEKEKADRLLAQLRGEPETPKPKNPEIPSVKQKYNSQFNPWLARQNYD